MHVTNSQGKDSLIGTIHNKANACLIIVWDAQMSSEVLHAQSSVSFLLTH